MRNNRAEPRPSVGKKVEELHNVHPALITKRPKARMTIISNQIVYDIPEEESEWDDNSIKVS